MLVSMCWVLCLFFIYFCQHLTWDAEALGSGLGTSSLGFMSTLAKSAEGGVLRARARAAPRASLQRRSAAEVHHGDAAPSA